MENSNKLITGAEALNTFIRSIEVNGDEVPISGGTAEISVGILPSVTSEDDGKVLMVSGGAWIVSPVVNIYTGSETPSQTLGKDGDIYLQT